MNTLRIFSLGDKTIKMTIPFNAATWNDWPASIITFEIFRRDLLSFHFVN